METSDKKRAASQANGRKSKGPKTPQGKRNSSKNALRHGVLANSVLVTGECRKRFIQLLDTLKEELAPQGLMEEFLVERIAVSQWRLKRIWTVESCGISREIRDQNEFDAKENNPTRTWIAMRALANNGSRSDLMNLYEHRFDSIQHRAFEALMRHQRNRLADKRTRQVDENKASGPEKEPTENPCETR